MDVRIPFLTGLGLLSAGAFIRSCASDLPSALTNAWCGVAPPPGAVALTHEHCIGCGLIAGGIALVAFSPFLLRLPVERVIRVRAA